jgi:hypothetical protein
MIRDVRKKEVMSNGSFTARCKEGSKKTEEQEEVILRQAARADL